MSKLLPNNMVFNIFKKKKPEAKKEIKAEAKKEIKKEEPALLKKTLFAYRILRSPRITEKATGLAGLNQYTFEVAKDANKTEIKKAIQELYGVQVLALRIINIPRRQRRFRGKIGWSESGKKAIVKIKKGQKIEVLPR